MQGHKDRILTTHVGSLPRTVEVLDAMKAKHEGEPYDEDDYRRKIGEGVREIVKRQADLGIDVVADGEMSKTGFFAYIEERIEGFEPRRDEKYNLFAAETAAFPEYYAEYFARVMMGGAIVAMAPMYCVGPVSYKGEEALARDLDNLKAALAEVSCHDAFVPAVSPAGVGYNAYYGTEEEYAGAVARRSGPNISPSSMPASCCRSTTRSSATSSSIPRSTMPARTANADSMSRRSTTRCAASTRTGSAITPATASTKARGSTKRRWTRCAGTCST